MNMIVTSLIFGRRLRLYSSFCGTRKNFRLIAQNFNDLFFQCASISSLLKPFPAEELALMIFFLFKKRTTKNNFNFDNFDIIVISGEEPSILVKYSKVDMSHLLQSTIRFAEI